MKIKPFHYNYESRVHDSIPDSWLRLKCIGKKNTPNVPFFLVPISVCLFMIAIINSLWFVPLAIAFYTVLLKHRSVTVSMNRIVQDEIPSVLEAAFHKMLKGHQSMEEALGLDPEGKSSKAALKTYEELTHEVATNMQAVVSAYEAQSSHDRGNPVWVVTETLREQAEELAKSATNYANSIAYARASNIKDSISNERIMNFSEGASSRMMTYRALVAGPQEEEEGKSEEKKFKGTIL